ncbi:hypothetical protein BC829DRAFT_414568 [Chytridium lagenaria]|nr:hypothetical protein BC829DRAFT_414568 [Chytridium lagenaria]
MPDLSALAKIVDDQIRSLVGIGKRIAAQGNADDALRNGMPEACEEVLKASDLLLTSTSQLVRDPYSSPGRGQLLDSAVVTLGQLTSKRITEILDPNLQARLHTAVKGLVRESPLLMSACRMALSNPGVVEARQIRSSACARMERVCREIEEVVRIGCEEGAGVGASVMGEGVASFTVGVERDVGKMKRKVDEAAAGIRSAVASSSEAALKNALYDYKQATTAVVADTKRTIDNLKSRELKNDLQVLSDVITHAEPKIASAAQAALDRPESPRHQQELLSLLDLASEKHSALVTSRTRALLGELTVSLSTLSDRRLIATPYVTFLESAEEATDLNSREALRMVNLTTLAQEGVSEGGKEIGEIRERLTGMVPALMSAGRMVVMNPADGTAKDYLEHMCEAWEGSAREMLAGVMCQEGSFKMSDLLTGARNALDMHSEALETASNVGDTERFRKESNDLVACASHFLSIARKEVDLTEDQAYKVNLDIKIKEIERDENHQRSSKITVADSVAIQGQVKELASRFTSIGDLIRNHRGIVPDSIPDQPKELPATPDLSIQGISVQLLENVLSDVVFVEEEPPMPLSEAEAKANPIQAAAQELKIEASHWTSKDNPIIDAVQKMSARLTDLAPITPSSAKTALPKQNALSSPPPNKSYKRLKSALLLNLDRIDTLAQQLKIIAAVKTASPGDTDRDLQLVGCAQNLMMAVKSCLGNAEAGSLRAAKGWEKNAGGKAKPMDMIRFRRNFSLYFTPITDHYYR